MDDLISRQALCEYALNQKDKSITPNDIMRFPSAQQWIPCSERLPVKDGNYLVSNSRNAFEAVFVEGEWYSMSLNLLLDGVLAWMPLPTQWEGGQDE